MRLEYSPWENLPGSLGTKWLTFLFVVEGWEKQQRGKPAEALSAYLTGLDYAQQALREGLLLHHLVTLVNMRIVLNRLAALPASLPKEGLSDGLARLQELYAEFPSLQSTLTEEIRFAGQVGVRMDPDDARWGVRQVWKYLTYDHEIEPVKRMALAVRDGIRPFRQYKKEQETILSTFSASADRPWTEIQHQKPPHFSFELSKRSYGNLRKAILVDHLRWTQFRMVLLEFALHLHKREHGRFPENLKGLTPALLKEPPTGLMSGKPFGYRLLGREYILYSVGPDGRDDGGRVAEDRISEDMRGDLTLSSFASP
jgi:hypothetical protein